MYIQDIEQTHEPTLKGNYFPITTKTDYTKSLMEENEIVKWIYPQRPATLFNTQSQSSNILIINTNVSTYAHTLMTFHESKPVPEQSSKKK